MPAKGLLGSVAGIYKMHRSAVKRSIHKTVSFDTPTCSIVHVLRQTVPADQLSLKENRHPLQSGRLIYEKSGAPANRYHYAPLFTYHIPNNASPEGKMTPYSSILGIPECRAPPRPLPANDKEGQASPSLHSSTRIPRGILPVSPHSVTLEALEQRRRRNRLLRAFNKRICCAQLETALKTMTYDATFDAHEYLRNDTVRDLRARSLEILKQKYCSQGEINFAEYKDYCPARISYKDLEVIEEKQLQSITSNDYSFIGQYDNTDYKLRWKDDDMKTYSTGDTHSKQLQRRRQMMIDMRVDQYCEDDAAAEYVAMYGVFSKFRGLDVKRSVKIPHLVNGIYNDFIDVIYMRPALEFNADSSFDAAEDPNIFVYEEQPSEPQHHISGLTTPCVSKEAKGPPSACQTGSCKSRSVLSTDTSRDTTASNNWVKKHHFSGKYPIVLPTKLVPPGIQGRESSPNVSGSSPFVYQPQLPRQDNQHFTSFALPNVSADSAGDARGNEVLSYIANALKLNVTPEDPAEHSSVLEVSDNVDFLSSDG